MRILRVLLVAPAALGGCAAERPATDGPRPLSPSPLSPSPLPTLPLPVASAPGPGDPEQALGEKPEGPPEPSSAREPPGRTLYSKARYVYVHTAPDASSDWLGYLWTGSTVRVKDKPPRYGKGCSGPYYEIEPRGFVCQNGKASTLDPDDAVVVALRAHGPSATELLPYRYGESLGLVRYWTLPSPEIQRRNESDLERHLWDVARARRGERVKSLSGVDVKLPAAAPPPMPELARTVHRPRTDLFKHSTVAYTREARLGERGFLLTADYGWIPKDRVRPYEPSRFRGVRLGIDAKLPLAFFRKRDRVKYRRAPDGAVVRSDEFFPRLGFVELSGESVEQNGERFLVTREPGVLVNETDAVVPKPPEPLPWSDAANADVGTATSERAGARKTFILVSIGGGWLLAFEGSRPVYATLVSPGRGGKPIDSRPTLETASTPLGSFTISLKILTATMEAPTELVHSDVPWVQNFTGPYSLHSAYWHDDWGELVSAGCVNLSPADARWLFDFSEPRLPEGWHAVRREPGDSGTRVILHD